MFQGGSSSKKSPRLSLRELNFETPREALVQPCEWPSDYFMNQAGFKEEFYMYVDNAGLTTSCQISACNITISLILLCGDLSIQCIAIHILFYLISMKNHFAWTLKNLMKHAKLRNGAFILNLANLIALSSLLASLRVKLEA